MSEAVQSAYMLSARWCVNGKGLTDRTDGSSIGQYAWLLDLVWRLEMAILCLDYYGGCELCSPFQLDARDLRTVSDCAREQTSG
jgi:hypothetical protein